ncbi:MAG: RnfABCDGE type electron transport complex subunit D [Treponema sp.]|nr:RnfABCDGE type electron transport complex subunit D [Treponema sp.]
MEENNYNHFENINNNLSQNITGLRPFIHISPSISMICIKLFVLLSLQVLMLILTKSYNSLALVITSFCGAACASSLSYLIYKDPIYNSWPILIQGILIGLLLPETYPLATVFIITFITLFVSRTLVFKSINAWVNVPVVAVIIAWFIGSNYFPSFLISNDMLTLKNPSTYLIQNGTFNIYNFDARITEFLNSTVFRFLKINIPEGYVSLWWDCKSIIPAFRFNFLTIISSIVIFSDNSFNPTVPTFFVTVYIILVRLFAPMMFGGSINSGDILLALLTSGTMFTATFLIQWFGTTPITLWGKIIYGCIAGCLAFLITGCGTSPIGMVYTVLVSNIVNLLIRYFEEKNNKIKLNVILNRLDQEEIDKVNAKLNMEGK